jgi:phosphoenolpyruvate phosphomutase
LYKSTELRALFARQDVIRVIGAHDGLGAKLIEKHGFEGVWASGFEVSTSHAVPDANILTMTQFMDAASMINDATRLPVIADCDTGYGNSNNVIYMVKKYEALGIAAVCIEDKKFPKVNSFIPGRQELAPVAEFVGKIKAAKDAQRTKDFMLIARVEALVAGWGQAEALKRAKAYADAGADAILIHSKSKSADEIVEFCRAWDKRAPLVIVPTTYPEITEAELNALGVKVVIYANHGMRASIKAMDEVLAEIARNGGIHSINEKIAPMSYLFDLQGMNRMKEQEKIYLKTEKEPVRVVIPAAGEPRDQESLATLLKDIPAAMLNICGKPLLQRNVETLNILGLNNIVVIGGYKSEQLRVEGINILHNKAYNNSGVLSSIMLPDEEFDGRTLIIFADILFEKYLMERLLGYEADIVLLVDSTYKKINARNKRLDLVVTELGNIPYKRAVSFSKPNRILRIGKNIPEADAHYEFIGVGSFSRQGYKAFRKLYELALKKYSDNEFHESSGIRLAGFTDMIQEMIDNGENIYALEVTSGWMEIHTMENYEAACAIFK